MKKSFKGVTQIKKSPKIPEEITKEENPSLIVCTFAKFKELCPDLEPSETPYAFNITDLTTSDVQDPDNPNYNYKSSLPTTMRYVKSGVLLDLSVTHLPIETTNMYGTFQYCTSLTVAPTIPVSVTDMIGTFQDCTSLTVVPAIPNSVTNMIGTFSNCTSLTTAPTIPGGVTNMISTFYGCTSLTTVPTIPDSVTNMIGTFQDCTSLKEIASWNKTTNTMWYKTGCFGNCTALENIYVPAGTETDWEIWFGQDDWGWPSSVSLAVVVKEQK